MPSPNRPPRSIHRSMQHITGIRVIAGLSLPSLTAFVACSLGVRKAPPATEGGLTGPPSVSAFHMLQHQTSHQKSQGQTTGQKPLELGSPSKASCTLEKPNPTWQATISCFSLLGYRGIVHPPSDVGGTERTWFEPEQRPRKRVPTRSVHGKQSPPGAIDQPGWQDRSCHDTCVSSCKVRTAASATM